MSENLLVGRRRPPRATLRRAPVEALVDRALARQIGGVELPTAAT